MNHVYLSRSNMDNGKRIRAKVDETTSDYFCRCNYETVLNCSVDISTPGREKGPSLRPLKSVSCYR